jgi:lipoprotein-anchoring transpeptidase ErfK/SrfK
VDYPIELFISQGYGRFGNMTFPILGGERGAPTPTGRFILQRKELAYTSKKYKTPMPYSLFFTDAHAIHYGALDVPSRGCVHVDYRTAQILYYSTITGKTRVIIHP